VQGGVEWNGIISPFGGFLVRHVATAANPMEATMWRAVLGEVVIAEAPRTTVVAGSRFFPPDSVLWELLRASATTRMHPLLGVAHYFDVVDHERVASNAAWCYPHPRPDALNIKSYVAFHGDVVVEPVAGPPRRRRWLRRIRTSEAR
jgi:uncharacterized protein (DUF427 family)